MESPRPGRLRPPRNGRQARVACALARVRTPLLMIVSARAPQSDTAWSSDMPHLFVHQRQRTIGRMQPVVAVVQGRRPQVAQHPFERQLGVA
jgi:hypothetical protein